jgi:hypothetical protein
MFVDRVLGKVFLEQIGFVAEEEEFIDGDVGPELREVN